MSQPSIEKVALKIVDGFSPKTIPGLISYWNFSESGESFSAAEGEDYVLKSQTGTLAVVEEPKALGGRALVLEGDAWLNIKRNLCPKLDIHGPDGQMSIVTWVKRGQKENNECEFLAGQWNESHFSRQYGLFLNIRIWGQSQKVTGHLSHVGGPTPGYPYCIDGPAGSRDIPRDEWYCVGMSYDGTNGFVWVDGVLDSRPGLNSYSMAGGLHDGGINGSDFTVGAVDRSGVIGNFFHGHMAGLAIYDRALTPAEFSALNQLQA